MSIRQVANERAVMSDSTHDFDEHLSARNPSLELEQALVHIRESLRGLEFGVLSIIVQDGVVIQIDRTERKRLRKRSGGKP
jgi:hypothetical protein